MAYIVAIDGTAGSGKGTVTKEIITKRNMLNMDTGMIYRCMALDSINKNILLEDTESLKSMLNDIDVDIRYENGIQTPYLNGEDVSNYIRTKEVDGRVSQVSAIYEIRLRANEIIRKIANNFLTKNISVVIEGRDIGTCVFPDAPVKIYMDASLEERTRRRIKQNEEKGISNTAYEEVLENLRFRDENDKSKPFGALKQAEDAVYIDTTNMTIEEVTNRIIEIIDEKTK